MTNAITVTIPGLKLVSEANAHTHWRVRQRRAKAQKHAVYCVLASVKRCTVYEWGWCAFCGEDELRVTITRIGPRSLDSDNAVSSAKHVRDAVAAMMAVNDRDPRVEWCVDQRKGKPREYAVDIRIEARAGGTR